LDLEGVGEDFLGIFRANPLTALADEGDWTGCIGVLASKHVFETEFSKFLIVLLSLRIVDAPRFVLNDGRQHARRDGQRGDTGKGRAQTRLEGFHGCRLSFLQHSIKSAARIARPQMSRFFIDWSRKTTGQDAVTGESWTSANQ
jgi:hypothetical protein